MQGSPGTGSGYKTPPCSPGTGQVDDTQCPARNQVPGLPRVMPGSPPVLRPRWALDASLCPSHRSLSLDRRPRASHDPGFPATAASSRLHRAPLPLRVPEAAPPTRSPAVTSCHLLSPASSRALCGLGFARTREAQERRGGAVPDHGPSNLLPTETLAHEPRESPAATTVHDILPFPRPRAPLVSKW